MVQFKLRSVVLALYKLVLWFLQLFSPIKNAFSRTHQSFNRHEHRIDVPSNIASSSPLSPSPSPFSGLSTSSSIMNLSSLYASSSSSGMGDFLGTDSGVCMGSTEDLLQCLSSPGNVESNALLKRTLKQRNDRKKNKKYPPALPLLACTGNLPGRYPWILHREYIDGRLILKEMTIHRYEYLEAQREHGRLVLNLAPLNDPLSCCTLSSPNGKMSRKNSAALGDLANARGK